MDGMGSSDGLQASLAESVNPLLDVVVRFNTQLLAADGDGKATLVSRLVAVIQVCALVSPPWWCAHWLCVLEQTPPLFSSHVCCLAADWLAGCCPVCACALCATLALLAGPHH
jgi:hypothetical protein